MPDEIPTENVRDLEWTAGTRHLWVPHPAMPLLWEGDQA